MSKRLTIEDLEQMKVHELADLLENIVLALRRLPDVELHLLHTIHTTDEPPSSTEAPRAGLAKTAPAKRTRSKASSSVAAASTPGDTTSDPAEEPAASFPIFTEAELQAKKVEEVRTIAKALHLTFTSKTPKKELVSKILKHQERGYSDQFAIQYL